MECKYCGNQVVNYEDHQEWCILVPLYHDLKKLKEKLDETRANLNQAVYSLKFIAKETERNSSMSIIYSTAIGGIAGIDLDEYRTELDIASETIVNLDEIIRSMRAAASTAK